MDGYLATVSGTRVYEDGKLLSSVNDIEGFIHANAIELFDAEASGEEETDIIVKIENEFYSVYAIAEIMRERMDRSEPLYWVEEVKHVSYEEIDDPYTLELLSALKKQENPQIEAMFTYHPPKAGQPERYTKIRDAAKDFAYMIDELCPNSREKSLALTNLQQAGMWANAAIAVNE